MKNALRDYRASLKKLLCCCGGTRRRLLAQFDQMSAPFLEENPSPSQEELIKAFGTPQTLAAQLMEEVAEPERRQYRRRQWLLRISILIVTLVFACYAVWVAHCVAYPVELVETIIVYEEVPE